MTPPHQSRRIGLIAIFGLILALGVYVLLSALKGNTQLFFNASDVIAEGFDPGSNAFRIGGEVIEGSVEKDDGLTTIFKIKDFKRDMAMPITVTYIGVLPDLFREGQGVVVLGHLTDKFSFTADEVLAKHDENYQPDIKYQSEK